MIILPNKNEKYVKEMNSLIFSHDIEEQIMSNILKHKKKNINIYIYIYGSFDYNFCMHYCD